VSPDGFDQSIGPSAHDCRKKAPGKASTFTPGPSQPHQTRYGETTG